MEPKTDNSSDPSLHLLLMRGESSGMLMSRQGGSSGEVETCTTNPLSEMRETPTLKFYGESETYPANTPTKTLFGWSSHFFVCCVFEINVEKSLLLCQVLIKQMTLQALF